MPGSLRANRVSHDPAISRQAGFTMVELIIVMVLVGILAAVGAARFFNRTGFDTASSAEQVRALVRYGQKLAIAQNRNVYITGSLSGVALCYSNSLPCPASDIVRAAGGSNSGGSATRAFCVSGSYVANWACEGFASGVNMVPVSGTFSPFYFNGLGKPFLPPVTTSSTPAAPSPLPTTAYKFTGDGVSIQVTIYQETGYVD